MVQISHVEGRWHQHWDRTMPTNVLCADCRWPLTFVKSREMALEFELPAKLRRCWKKLAGHNFNVRAKSFWEKSDFLAEKWISWKWIETPGDKRLDERRRADFRWTLMFWLRWGSGLWWRRRRRRWCWCYVHQVVEQRLIFVMRNAKIRAAATICI